MIPQRYFEQVKSYFMGDTQKTWAWFTSSNKSLGFVSPLNALKAGLHEKVKKVIQEMER